MVKLIPTGSLIRPLPSSVKTGCLTSLLSPHSGSNDTCKLPGCSNPKYQERNGLQHDFCGRTHAQMYRQMYGFTPPPPSYSGMKKSDSQNWTFQITQSVVDFTYLFLGASPYTERDGLARLNLFALYQKSTTLSCLHAKIKVP